MGYSVDWIWMRFLTLFLELLLVACSKTDCNFYASEVTGGTLWWTTLTSCCSSVGVQRQEQIQYHAHTSATALSNDVGLPFNNSWCAMAGRSPVKNRCSSVSRIADVISLSGYDSTNSLFKSVAKSLTLSLGPWQRVINDWPAVNSWVA